LDNSDALEKTGVSERFEAYQTYNKPKQFLGSNFRKVENDLPKVSSQKPKGLMSMNEARYTPTPPSSSISTNDLQENQKVHHEKFGTGTIKSVEQNGEKIVVLFDTAGEKTLLTKFAKLTKFPLPQR
jgi:DNA helicase-2/ATP-dependent DNA helicase PcrA